MGHDATFIFVEESDAKDMVVTSIVLNVEYEEVCNIFSNPIYHDFLLMVSLSRCVE